MESTETTPLCVFVAKARASNRLLYGDLRRLQRDVLPAGASSREEVEALLSLDWIERVDKDWPGYLARVVTDFMLSTSDPSGDALNAETAAWLVSLLAHLKPKTAAVVLRSLSVEALQIEEGVMSLSRRVRAGHPISAPKGLRDDADPDRGVVALTND